MSTISLVDCCFKNLVEMFLGSKCDDMFLSVISISVLVFFSCFSSLSSITSKLYIPELLDSWLFSLAKLRVGISGFDLNWSIKLPVAIEEDLLFWALGSFSWKSWLLLLGIGISCLCFWTDLSSWLRRFIPGPPLPAIEKALKFLFLKALDLFPRLGV